MFNIDESASEGLRDHESPEAMQAALAFFIGTELYHQHSVNFYLTDGAKYLADHAKCYWLFDAIASHQPELARHPDERFQYLQFWKLMVNADESAVLTCVPDSGEPPAVMQKIELTDFPLPEIRIWVGCEGRRRVTYLPTEH